jgi:two-component system, LuxR family, sensor kinase FixL
LFYAVSDVRLASVFNSAKQAMLVLDDGGFVLFANAACQGLFGRTTEQITGRHVKSLMPPKIAEERGDDFVGYFQQAEANGDARLQGGGKEFPVEVLFSEAGVAEDRQYLLIVHEPRNSRVDERLLDLQADLMRTARMSAMEDMSAAVTHKLNQPLTAVILYLQAIERVYGRETLGGPLPDRVVAILEKAVREAERASNMLQRMRQFLEQRESMPRLIDLNQTLEAAIELTVLASRPGMHIARLLTPRLPPVLVDQAQLRQALVNLIRGAMDAVKTRDHPGIRVATHRFHDHVAVVVETNGVAYHDEAMNGSSVFSDDKRVYGKEIAMSRAIAQDHGGDLLVDSGERMQGTRFTLQLPLPASATAPA